MDYYVRPDEALTFGALTLTEISYVARGEQLVAVALRASGREATLALAQMLDGSLGAPVASDADEGSVTWTKGEITVTMRLVPDTNDTLALVMRTRTAASEAEAADGLR
jgi:hypothetical protein